MKQNVGTQIFQYQYLRTSICVPVHAGIQDVTVAKKIEMAWVIAIAVRTGTFFFLQIDKDCKTGPCLVLKIARSLMCVSGP